MRFAKNMVKLLILFVLFVICGLNSKRAAAQDATPPAGTPQLDFVFEETVTLGPSMHPGPTPFGERNIVPITGGVFAGPHIRGKVLSGGWDWQLATKNGCNSLQANYMIQTDDGVIINVDNRGRLCSEHSGNAKRNFTTPVFEAPLGPYEWLNSGAYVGSIEGATLDGKPAVRIRFYQAH